MAPSPFGRRARGASPPNYSPAVVRSGTMSTREQWVATWERLGAAAPEGVYEKLVARYSEPQRHYHTARHLAECFAELAAVCGEAEHPAEVEIALWFHDAVYDTKRHDNEQRSADGRGP